jgi:hypothetical protein
MTTESTPTEGQELADGPIDPSPYTRLTVTFREPLVAPEDAITATVTFQLSDEIWPEDITHDGAIGSDDLEDLFQSLDQALTDAGRRSSFRHLESGDAWVIAYENVNGAIEIEHAYECDGLAYLCDMPWAVKWEFGRA